MTTQPNGAMPPLAIPRITPPMGERAPLHDQPVTPLTLEPSVVPSPALKPEDIPRMPKPTPAAPPPAVVLTPPKPPFYVLPDAPYPQSEAPTIEQVLWCMARFPLEGPEGVRATWEPAIGAEAFDAAFTRFRTETTAYAQALEAYEKARQPAPAAAPTPVAQVVTNPPQPETKTLPLGSTVHYTPAPVPAVLQQPGALEIGAYWSINGTPAQIGRFGAPTHNPLDQEVFLRTEAGNEHVTQVKFLASPTSGWTFLRAPAKPEPELDRAAIAAVHHDAPAVQGGAQEQASAPAQGETRRRLTAAAKQRCLELHAAGKTKMEIAQATGLPMELVERALAAVPPAAQQAEVAEKAYQQSLASGGSEQEARDASTKAVEHAITNAIAADQEAMTADAALPVGTNKRLMAACIVASSLEQGLSAYKAAGNYLDQLKVMREELDFLITQIEGGS